MRMHYVPPKRRVSSKESQEERRKGKTSVSKTRLEESFNTLKNLKNEINLTISHCVEDRKKMSMYSEDLFNKLTSLKKSLYSVDDKFKEVAGFIVMKKFFDEVFKNYSLSRQETIDGITYNIACIPMNTDVCLYPEMRDLADDMRREENRSILKLWSYALEIMEPLELYLSILENKIL